jgi:hypothetical protein
MKKHIENRLCPEPEKVTAGVAYAKDARDATRFAAYLPRKAPTQVCDLHMSSFFQPVFPVFP